MVALHHTMMHNGRKSDCIKVTARVGWVGLGEDGGQIGTNFLVTFSSNTVLKILFFRQAIYFENSCRIMLVVDYYYYYDSCE